MQARGSGKGGGLGRERGSGGTGMESVAWPSTSHPHPLPQAFPLWMGVLGASRKDRPAAWRGKAVP